MNYSCTICFEPLQANGDVPAVLQCGHVYHRNCINHWLSASAHGPQCPLCKKKVSKTKMITPVYFSSNDETMASSSSNADSTEQNFILQQEIIRLKQMNNTLETQNNSEKQKTKALETENKRLKEDNQVLSTQKRLMKAIRKVADLDDRLASEPSKMYLRGIKRLPMDDLLVHLGTWRVKFEASNDKIERQKKLLEKREREILHLTKKCERYKETINSGQSGQSSSNSAQFNLRKTFENVIVLDTDSDDENETESQSRPNFANDELVDEEEDFRVEEHNTSHVNRRSKRRIDLSEDEDSIFPRSKRILQIDLSQDNDEDRVHAGPSSDYSA